jgi:hypothetical protein
MSLVWFVLVFAVGLVSSQCIPSASVRDHFSVWTNGQSTLYDQPPSNAKDSPGSRRLMSMAVYADDGYLFGGYGFSGSPAYPSVFSDVWKYSGQTWSLLSPSFLGLNARSGAMIWAVGGTNGGELVVFGGATRFGNTYFNDMFVYRIASRNWTEVTLVGARPTGRASAAVWTAGRRLYMFGGRSLVGLMSDLWYFDLDAKLWTAVGSGASNAGSVSWPGARVGACSWIVTDSSGTVLMLFGGEGFSGSAQQGKLADTWFFSLVTNKWTVQSVSVPVNYVTNWTDVPATLLRPGARSFAASWLDRKDSSPYFFGGESSSAILGDLWRFSLQSQLWEIVSELDSKPFTNVKGCYGTQQEASVSNRLPSRHSGGAWALGDEVVLFGGVGPNNGDSTNVGMVEDTWKLVWTTDSGLNIPAVVVPLVLALLVLLLLLFLLYRRWRRRQQPLYVVDLGGGAFKANTLFRPNSNQSTYDFADLLGSGGVGDSRSDDL